MIGTGSYTIEQIEKLGNAMIYLTERLGMISKTRMLKLIYILEEVSISKHGTPFFNIPFEVWELGPVPKDIFVQLSNPLTYLSKYIDVEFDNRGKFIKPIIQFCDDEFSDNDIAVLDLILDKFGNLETSELINYTHRPGSLWDNLTRKYGLLEEFKVGSSSTEIKIDFSHMFEENTVKYKVYNDYLEFFEAAKPLIS